MENQIKNIEWRKKNGLRVLTRVEQIRLETAERVLFGRSQYGLEQVDYFVLTGYEMVQLEALMKAFGYRGNNGLGRSRTRQFYYYLQKLAELAKQETNNL